MIEINLLNCLHSVLILDQNKQGSFQQRRLFRKIEKPNDPAKPQTCSRRLEVLDPLDHKELPLRFGNCCSSSSPVLE
jgi:hypothetical protein